MMSNSESIQFIPIQFRLRAKSLRFNSDSTLEYTSLIQSRFQFHRPWKYLECQFQFQSQNCTSLVFTVIVSFFDGNACQDLFEMCWGKYQCWNQKDEPCMFYYEIGAHFNTNAYMHEQTTIGCGVRISGRKYLNWCTPFSDVSQCYTVLL